MTFLTATDGGLFMGLCSGISFYITIIWEILSAVKIAINRQENQRNYLEKIVFIIS
jgi:hypothetical protein